MLAHSTTPQSGHQSGSEAAPEGRVSAGHPLQQGVCVGTKWPHAVGQWTLRYEGTKLLQSPWW